MRFRQDHWPSVDGSVLAYGNGRSYGDNCQNAGGYLLATRNLDRFIRFDAQTGHIRCESGVLLQEVLTLTVGSGWFLPVTPGTQFVTIGGAIANDVHGKNHHVAGTFGHHLTCFELLRSDGSRTLCSSTQNPGLFRATIGGLGLTGVIIWAEFRLKRISNPYLRVQTVRFPNLEAFFELAAESDREHEYTVAWIDCVAKGHRLGRGLYMAGNHAAPACREAPHAPQRRLGVPGEPPVCLISNLALKSFNALYYHKQLAQTATAVVHYAPFFYPLDTVNNWNRVYGPRGFLQYQSVVPMKTAAEVTHAMLERIARSGQGSFLSVLKVFGDKQPAGLLSFPRSGVTLALDFPNRGAETFTLLEELDELVADAGGAIYPAKDARMSPERFAASFPALEAFARYIDPGCSSSLWRRVTER
jgi:FAD/FMN-containing dehydrogenase